jgi:hypothetical protein
MKNNKKTLSLLAGLFLFANIAKADFDLAAAITSDVFSAVNVTDVTAADNFTGLDGKVFKKTTDTTSYTTSKFIRNIGGEVALYYCLAEGFYAGIRSGFTLNLSIKDTKWMEAINEAEAKEQTTATGAMIGVDYMAIPILVDLKYNIVQIIEDLNFFVTAKAGSLIGFGAEAHNLASAITLAATSEAAVYGATLTDAKVDAGAFSLLGILEAGIGIEYIGIQFSALYSLAMPSGYVKEIIIDALENKYDAISVSQSRNVSTHSFKMSVGYLFSNLF